MEPRAVPHTTTAWGVRVPDTVLQAHGVDSPDNLPSDVLDTHECGGQCLRCGRIQLGVVFGQLDGNTVHHVQYGDDQVYEHADPFDGHICSNHYWPYWRARRARHNCKVIGKKVRLVLSACTVVRENLLAKHVAAKFATGGVGADATKAHFAHLLEHGIRTVEEEEDPAA